MIANSMLNEERISGVAHVMDIKGRAHAEGLTLSQMEGQLRLNVELACFDHVSAGHQLHMVELRKVKNEFCLKGRLPERYDLDFGEDEP